VSAKVIRVASRDLGRNTLLSDGFALGTLPGGGYGIRWRKGAAGRGESEYWFPWEPGGLGATIYWFPWGPPQDPVRIEFEGREFIFCRETASEAELARARRVAYEHLQEGR
jgi:hypothetical protein